MNLQATLSPLRSAVHESGVVRHNECSNIACSGSIVTFNRHNVVGATLVKDSIIINIERVKNVFVNSFLSSYKHEGIPTQRHKLSHEFDEQIDMLCRYDTYRLSILYTNKLDVGAVVLYDNVDNDCVYIAQLAVHNSMKGMGIGTYIVCYVAHRTSKVCCLVRIGNRSALKFYDKFEPTSWNFCDWGCKLKSKYNSNMYIGLVLHCTQQ